MQELGTGAGLAALGFWLFVASAVAITFWDKIRKRDAQHETLRRVVESGQTIDDSLTDKLLSITGSVESKDLERDLKVSGLIVLSLAPGMLLLGWFMSSLAGELLVILSGVSALMVCLAIGLLGASVAVRRRFSSDDESLHSGH
jgi:hypothetical protein